MDRKDRFADMLKSVLEVAKVQGNILKGDDIKRLFGDMNLTEEQYEHIFAYILANNIKIEGNVEKSFEKVNEYTNSINTEESNSNDISNELDIDTKEDKPSQEQIEEQKESIYLKMYMEDLGCIHELTSEEEAILVSQITQGKEYSKNKIIEGYLKFVVKIAKEYCNKGVLIEDLIGEGNMGLMDGVNHLSLIKDGESLQLFLETYIRKSLDDITKDYTNSQSFEKTVMDKASYISEATKELAEDLGRVATLTELSSYTKISIEELKDILNMSGESIKVGKDHKH